MFTRPFSEPLLSQPGLPHLCLFVIEAATKGPDQLHSFLTLLPLICPQSLISIFNEEDLTLCLLLLKTFSAFPVTDKQMCLNPEEMTLNASIYILFSQCQIWDHSRNVGRCNHATGPGTTFHGQEQKLYTYVSYGDEQILS